MHHVLRSPLYQFFRHFQINFKFCQYNRNSIGKRAKGSVLPVSFASRKATLVPMMGIARNFAVGGRRTYAPARSVCTPISSLLVAFYDTQGIRLFFSHRENIIATIEFRYNTDEISKVLYANIHVLSRAIFLSREKIEREKSFKTILYMFCYFDILAKKEKFNNTNDLIHT